MTCGIYKLTFPNGKSYIGQSKNIENRLSIHKKDSKRCLKKKPKNITKLWGHFMKYPWDTIKSEIIFICEQKDLNSKESYFIGKYDTFKNGLNCTTGGEGGYIRSKETLEKMRLYNRLGKYGGPQAMDFYIDDIKYQSILEASVALKIPHKTIHNRLNSNNEKFSNYIYADKSRVPNRKRASSGKRIKIKVDSVIYDSASDASMELNIPITTLLRRARSDSEKFKNYQLVK